MTPAEWTLFAVHGLIAYAWILFPLLLLMSRRRAPASDTSGPEPQLAVILSAYNEEAHIGGHIRKLLELDYPPTRRTVFVGVDGSSDRTASEARAAAARQGNVAVVEFPENRGKVAVLKDLVAQAHAASPAPEILVFTDANTAFSPDALRRLCAPFSDPAVGGVCGKLSFVTAQGSETEENVYWRVENWLKARESAIDSCLGANGAIYAIRSGLFWTAIPSNTIVDDFVIGMKIREQGYRLVYEPRAMAVEHLPAQIKDEWTRRVRIGAGDFQALRLCAACLKPSFGAFAWLFWSHKVLRWLTPHLMLAGVFLAGLASVPLGRWPGPVFLGLYAAFGMSALLGRFLSKRRGRLAQILRGAQYLLAMQAAIFMGFIRFCRGNLEGRWQRTARERQ